MIYEKTVKSYCCEDISLIENYEKAVSDTTQVWHCHHRLETQGQFYNSVELLKRCGMYYNVPASQLILLPASEHMKLHNGELYNPNLGKVCSEETKQKISESKKHLSDETRTKMSLARKGKKMSEETKSKLRAINLGKTLSKETRMKMSKSKLGKPSNAKGKRLSVSTREKLSKIRKGIHLSEETRRKISVARRGKPNLYMKGRRFFNNGVKSIVAYECPEGFVPGRLKKKEVE